MTCSLQASWHATSHLHCITYLDVFIGNSQSWLTLLGAPACLWTGWQSLVLLVLLHQSSVTVVPLEIVICDFFVPWVAMIKHIFAR